MSIVLLIAGFVIQKMKWLSFFCDFASTTIVFLKSSFQIMGISNVQFLIFDAL